MWLHPTLQVHPKATSESTATPPNLLVVVSTSSSSSPLLLPSLCFACASLHFTATQTQTQQDRVASKVTEDTDHKEGVSQESKVGEERKKKPWSMSSPMHVRKAVNFASLRAKLMQGKGGLALRLLLAAGLAAFLLVFAARSLSSPAPSPRHQVHQAATGECGDGSKVPAAVAEALVHYATSNTTPQQTADEIGVSLRVLQRRAPCNFLVFGLGLDSPMWAALNHGGRTVFLEEDASWIASVGAKHPSLESYHVTYSTVLTEADALLAELRAHPACVGQPDLAAASEASCRLAMRGLPPAFHEVEWDLIMVDAPTGWNPQAPGRMSAIYTAGMAARARRPGDGPTDVFVHDVDRHVEDAFSKAFLCEAYLAEQVGRIRHFVIPSHREKDGMPFCP